MSIEAAQQERRRVKHEDIITVFEERDKLVLTASDVAERLDEDIGRQAIYERLVRIEERGEEEGEEPEIVSFSTGRDRVWHLPGEKPFREGGRLRQSVLAKHFGRAIAAFGLAILFLEDFTAYLPSSNVGLAVLVFGLFLYIVGESGVLEKRPWRDEEAV